MLCRYERTIFKSDKGFCIFAYSTSDESVPKEARNRSYYHDDKIHFTAIGYHLIAKRIVSMILQEGFTKIDDLDGKIDNAERTLHQRLAPSQRNAVKLCLSHPISIMTGGPGSGKTTTLRFILGIYKAAFPANEVLLAAPTGRASRRMAEQTGMYASTLHPALGLVTDEDSPLNDKELLSADLVVVDEFSMVDMRLAYILLDRIKSGAQLIIVGDADQLPSVGAGNVLREMIRSEKVPTSTFSETNDLRAAAGCCSSLH